MIVQNTYSIEDDPLICYAYKNMAYLYREKDEIVKFYDYMEKSIYFNNKSKEILENSFEYL